MASRPQRWEKALKQARKLYDETEAKAGELQEAFQELESIRQEYEEWKDSLPENLQSSALGEKLDAVCGLDFSVEVDLSDLASMLDEAEGADLPRGFGRD